MSDSDNKFRIRFRGVRGSYPTPKKNFLKFGGNTACVEVKCGNQLIILDAGTGIIDVGVDEVRNSILEGEKHSSNTTVILSHLHQDHIQGLQFYKPLFIPSSKINLFGMNINNENLRDILNNVLFDKVFPLGLDEIKSDFNIFNFSDNDAIVISQKGKTEIMKIELLSDNVDKDDIVITAFKTFAHPKNGCLNIKINYKGKTLVYATDKESYIGADKKFIQFAYCCDCLIHDAQYTYQDYINPVQSKQGFGHSTFEMAIETSELAKAGLTYFFHYDPEYDDDKLTVLENEFQNKEKRIFFAKENNEIEL